MPAGIESHPNDSRLSSGPTVTMPSMTIQTRREGEVEFLQLDRPPGNALDLDTIQGLRTEIGRLAADDTLGAAVLVSGTDGYFSAGLDLMEMESTDTDGAYRIFNAYHALYRELFLFPRPLLAAISGHALGAGCVLALAADLRLGSNGSWTIGLSDVAFGLPLPPGIDAMAAHACGPAAARRMVLLGESLSPTEAHRVGLLDRLVPAERFEAATSKIARQLARSPHGSYPRQFGSVRETIAEAILDPRSLEAFITAWFGPEARRIRTKIVERLGRGE